MSRNKKVDVIVVGAGAAGLAAARDLSNSGLSAIVMEARDRIGGRVFTLYDRNWPLPVELGAEFVHGEAPETFSIIRAAGLAVHELPDFHYRSRDGRLSPIPNFASKMDEVRKDIVRTLRGKKSDLPLIEFLDSKKYSLDIRQMLINFVEGYHAAYPDKMSIRSLAGGDEEEESDNSQFRIFSGYDAVIHWLRAGLSPERIEVRLNTAAREIKWKRGEVNIKCTSRGTTEIQMFRAKSAMITVPQAVLKAKDLTFYPELMEKQPAVERLESGQIFKMMLRFRLAFWEEDDFVKKRLEKNSSASGKFKFVHTEDADIPVWWTTLPSRGPILTAWAGGPKADSLLNEDEETRLERSLDALAKVLAVPRRVINELLEGWSIHDWRADPYSRGAYMYIPSGGMPAQKALGKSVEGTLFFAGEATNLAEMGTVAGAIASGRRAARELIQARKG